MSFGERFQPLMKINVVSGGRINSSCTVQFWGRIFFLFFEKGSKRREGNSFSFWVFTARWEVFLVVLEFLHKEQKRKESKEKLLGFAERLDEFFWFSMFKDLVQEIGKKVLKKV